MGQFVLCSVVLIAMAIAAGAAASDASVARLQLASTGKLRIGVVFAPTASTFFVVKDPGGRPRGVTVDLGDALARQLNVPVDYFVAPNSGEVTDALEKGAIDLAFMPADEERRKRIDFGPAYFLVESTCLVAGSSTFKTNRDLDRAGVRVAGIANTTTIRSAARVLPSATVVAVSSVAEAMEMLRTGRADAFALSRDSLPPYQAQLPGSRILDGHLQTTGVAIAVPKNRPAALAYATTFIEDAKASGLVRQAFERAGLGSEAVAPAEGSR
jgi:polar amino acid transport system substrate-binding protein